MSLYASSIRSHPRTVSASSAEPFEELIERGAEGAAPLGQAILDLGRHLGIDLALDQHDERRHLAGPGAIRAWIEDSTRKYRPSVTPIDIEQVDGLSIVKVGVAGTFPGSPIELRFRFRLESRLIAALEIG